MFSSKVRSTLLALLFLGTCLVLTFRYESIREQETFRWFDRVVLTMGGPLARGIVAVRQQFRSIVGRYLYLVDVSEENEVLRGEIEDLKLKGLLLEQIRSENEDLRELLGLREQSLGEAVAARVTAVPPLGEFRILTLNRGSDHGLERRQPVIAPEGVVGIVSRVTPRSAQVLLITDPTSAVDVRVSRTGARGLLVGLAREIRMKRDLFIGAVEYMERKAALAEGDRVETTGLEGVFPPGITVGSIGRVTRKRHDVFLEAEVIPAVDFYALKQVLVLIRK